jgi:hypothetical protein
VWCVVCGVWLSYFCCNELVNMNKLLLVVVVVGSLWVVCVCVFGEAKMIIYIYNTFFFIIKALLIHQPTS